MRRAIISKKAVLAEIDAGNVRIAFHPRNRKLAILNYTQQAQFAQAWNPVTMRCRGLVVEWHLFGDNLPIIIDSPKKFFNAGEPQAPNLKDWQFGEIILTEKLDGYYISIRNDSKYGFIITSRGSFDNKYVEAAKKLCPLNLPRDVDFFCELCQTFPGDEGIIVTKHPEPELVCWGVGGMIPTAENHRGWPGKIANSITQEQFNDYMHQQVEGLVAFNYRTNERVKVKTQWYLEMHRLISNCTFKNVLEVVSGGGSFINTEVTTYTGDDDEKHTIIVSHLPEEHLLQMQKWEGEIHSAHSTIVLAAAADYDAYKDKTKKEYALENQSPQDIKNVVFAMMNLKDHDYINRLTWRAVKNRLLSNTTN